MRDLARALPRSEDLIGRAEQRLDVIKGRLPGALRAATQSKELMLQRAAAPLRPAILKGQTDRLEARLDAVSKRLGQALQIRADKAQAQFDRTAGRMVPVRLEKDIADSRKSLDTTSHNLSKVAMQQMKNWRDRIEAADRLRETLGYQATLDRGYAVVWAGSEVVTTKTKATRGITDIQFKDGKLKLAGNSKPKVVSPPTQSSLFDE